MYDITVNVAVSNADQSTPNFTAEMDDLAKFINSVGGSYKPAAYTFVYDEEVEKFLINGKAVDSIAGVTITATDPEEDTYADGDTVTVTVEASEVQVTDERNRPAGNYHDAVVDGVLYRGIPDRVIYVESESDLDDLTEELPGTVAMTYDEASKWRYDGADWVTIGGETEG